MTQNQQPLENFFEQYQPGPLIETEYRAALEGVNLSQVWTQVEEDGETLIFPRYRIVNRLGYFIASVPPRTPEEENLVFWAADEEEE